MITEVKFPLATLKIKPEASLNATQLLRYRVVRPSVAGHLFDARLNKQLSPHFALWEFVCPEPAYGLLRLNPKLLELLEKIREAAGGSPIHVGSGYRPVDYNAQLQGAAKRSTHIDGIAADIVARKLSAYELWRICNRLNPNGGVGRYASFVHVDVRRGRSRW